MIAALRLVDGGELWRDESGEGLASRHLLSTGDLAIYSGRERVVARRSSGEVL